MASLSGGGAMAGAAAAALTVSGSPYLGQLAGGASSHRLLAAVDVASQAFWHSDRAAEAAKNAAATASVAETAAKEAFRALQALLPAPLHVPLASLTQPVAAAATPGVVNGHGLKELLTQAPVGPASDVASPALSAAPLPFPPPPDLAAIAADAQKRRQHLPALDKLPSSSQAAVGHAAMQTSTAEADHHGLSAAGLPPLTTMRARPFASGRSGAAQPLLPAGASPRTPHAAVQMKAARAIRRRAWQSTRHAHLQNGTDSVGNVAAEELAADFPAAMRGHGELRPMGGPQAAADEGAAAADLASSQQDMQPSVEDVAMLEMLAAQRDEGVEAEQPLPAVEPQPLVPRRWRTCVVGLRKRVRVLVPPGTPTAWFATRQGSMLPQRTRSCYAVPHSFGAPQTPRGPAFAVRNSTDTRLSTGAIAEHAVCLFSADMRQGPPVKNPRPVSAAAEAGAAVLQELAASLVGHMPAPR